MTHVHGSTAVLPVALDAWTLWQFSDDNFGKLENPVPGVSPCDRNWFAGDRAALAAAWPLQ